MSKTKGPATGLTAMKPGLDTGLERDRAGARQNFVAAATTMVWQLAVVVLVPVIGGVELDKAVGTSFAFTLIGLGVALVGSGFVMWRATQSANRFPVPKLTDAERRAVKKSYEEDDD